MTGSETIRHPVHALFALVDNFHDYPSEVVPIPPSERRPETGFFPGNPGLWDTAAARPLPRWPLGGVLLIAHNYDCEATFRRTRATPPPPNSTPEQRWPPFYWLHQLLDDAGIALADGFYTNFFIGLKPGARTTGAFPGRRYPAYVAWCRTVLLETIALQQPRLLLTLGARVVGELGQWEPFSAWAGARRLATLDEQHTSLLPAVRFPGCPRPVTAVALTHPTCWPANVRWRHYGGLNGAEAERKLLADGARASGYYAV